MVVFAGSGWSNERARVKRTLLARLPKVVLHDHLDGGVRPATIIDLARQHDYRELPAWDPESLADWFDQGKSGSLERYLQAFRHTVAVMQTPGALQRIAAEAVADLAADGAVYAEIRFAPSLHGATGLDRDAVIEATLDGLREGSAATGCEVGLIVDAMRQDTDSEAVVEAALSHRGRGVVGFDLAGPEAGFPASNHLRACRRAVEGGLGLTIHAGEAAGLRSIADALEPCGAARIGHGIRIVEDLVVAAGAVTNFGPVARRILEREIPLEVCPTSNFHTGACPSPAAHPVGLLHRAGFPVTVNTDNRLMSRTSMTDELLGVVRHHGFEFADLRKVTLTAVEAAFCSEDVRERIRTRVEEGFLPAAP
jgi:adenosine deaminase